ncbi:hypothetical protein MtrunA17_Chr3g0123261 [Medicago truncatula]|uniref:Uncharacterized protein n=1 Tax=Medicago truncatula TaxID=3880 RepID=A0A396J264_MEDTR|nr:E3 ubiquitin-protein ligase RBBP6 [Medicago truncatula]RHN69307.1 hypothetical protein MtrunA17_Chr3g0123261 [Medicago truncatula]
MATPISDSGTVVFIDTNLDTHLALTVSDHDTVSDLKKLIVSEHASCFPKIGQIQIHGIKVKRNGHFYHLSDSMVVRSAFIGVNKSWFLSVDVSALEDSRPNEKLLPHGSLRQVESIGIVNNALVGSGGDNNGIILPCNSQFQLLENKKDKREGVRVVSPCVSEHTAKDGVANLENGVKLLGDDDTAIPLLGSNSKTDDRRHLNNEVPSLPMECEVDGLDKGNKDDGNVGVEESLMSVQSGKRKRQSKRKREDTAGGDNSKKETPSDRLRVKNLEMVPSLNIECEVDGPGGGNKDDRNVCEEPPSISVPSAKRRKKSTKKKEATVVGDRSKEGIPSDHPCVSEHTEKEAVKNLEVVQTLHIECEVDGSSERNKDDHNVCEEVPLISVPSAKRKSKSKKNKKDTVGGDNSKDNVAAVDNPVDCPSEKASSFNNFPVPQSRNKQDDKEVPFDLPLVSHNTEKEAVRNLEMVQNSHIECEVDDGSNKGTKDDSIVCEEGTSNPTPSAKKKKSKSKKKKEDTVGGDISKDNIVSVDNPLGCPSERASSFNNFQVSQSKNTTDEKEEILFDHACVPEYTEKAVTNLEMVPNSHTQSEVDGSDKGIKGDSMVCEKGTSKSVQSAKKKHKSVRKKEDTVQDDTNDASVAVPVQKRIVVLAVSAENADKEVTKVLKENNESNDNNTVNDVNAVTMKEASELKSPLKKKPKKRKRSPTDSKETLKGDTTSQKDEAQMADGAHEERKESEDIIINKTNLDKMEIGAVAYKESIQSTTKETGNNNEQGDIEMEVQPSDVNEPKDLLEDNENVLGSHCHESEVGQIEGAREGEVSPQNDDVNRMKEPVKPAKEQKGVKKGKNKGGGHTLRVDTGLVDASHSEAVVAKSLKETICDPLENAATQGSLLNQTEEEGMVLLQEEIPVLSVTDKGGDFSADNADSLEQTKTKSNDENVDELVSKRLKKKPNNKQSSTSKSTSDMLTNGHAFDSKKERDVHRIDKAPNAHKTRQVTNFSSPSNSAMSSVVENRKSRDNASGKSMDLEKQRKHIPISNAKLEGYNKMVQNKARKASGNNVMEVVSKSQQKKSLLEGATIFKDDSSSSSDDEGQEKVDNSDASTRTPSDNSHANYLDGYDSPGVDSRQNGSYDGERLENDERSPFKAGLSGTTKMSIDDVVRRSTRYKQARMTASQLDDTEVPESEGL